MLREFDADINKGDEKSILTASHFDPLEMIIHRCLSAGTYNSNKF